MLTVLIYIFSVLSLPFGVVSLLLWYKHRQWRRKLEPKFNQSTFCRRSGSEIVRTILDANQLNELPVLQGLHSKDNFFSPTQGKHGKVYLSPEHYNYQSLRTLAVAAHECGHAINFYFKQKVSYLKISQIAYIIFYIFLVSVVFTLRLFKINIWLYFISFFPYLVSIVFRLLEENKATYQGVKMLEKYNLIINEEKDFVKQYLNSNFLDYVYKSLFGIFGWNVGMVLVIINNISLLAKK
ncbi:hypothetical protein A6770_29265 [Nostoc minutum NIES-26]|uniref:Peptidase n=1 Tax=Nostoc minutum NIES-26 TaxID=1844469 RepID=A0A367QF75_9NOSO|nr:hypothetical protein A6770_29265 [Nostoc minutum NIES-26]